MKPAAPRQLWRYLWGWALAALGLVWGSLVLVAWSTGRHESRELTDGLLTAAARLLIDSAVVGATTPERLAPTLPLLRPDPDAPELRVLRWRGHELVWDSHGMAPLVTAPLRDGHQSVLDTQGAEWRALQVRGGDTRLVLLMAMDHRNYLAGDIAGHIARPVIFVIPLVALLLAWAMRRGLRPLNRLSNEIAALDTGAGQTLDEHHRFTEMAATVDAINRLVRQLQGQVSRERAFASDVAHEMRTPLAAIVWQAHAARQAGTPAEREAALRQTEQDALRAGHILGQLVELTCAHALDAREAEPLGLRELAAGVLAPFAQEAHASGHTLALQVPDGLAERQAPGHRLMLELALRNLVDNALRHTPRGTQVEVALGEDTRGLWLAVHDDGQRGGAGSDVAGGGLGLGLRLTERLAAWQGLVLARESAPAPFTTRFALRWPATPPG